MQACLHMHNDVEVRFLKIRLRINQKKTKYLTLSQFDFNLHTSMHLVVNYVKLSEQFLTCFFFRNKLSRHLSVYNIQSVIHISVRSSIYFFVVLFYMSYKCKLFNFIFCIVAVDMEIWLNDSLTVLYTSFHRLFPMFVF